jgi:hypothetical protein
MPTGADKGSLLTAERCASPLAPCHPLPRLCPCPAVTAVRCSLTSSSTMVLVVHYMSLASSEGSVQLRYGCIPQLAPGGIFAPAGVIARMGGWAESTTACFNA